MSLNFLSVVFLSILSLACALHNCTSFNDRNHGFGCELRGVVPNDEIFEITMMSRDNTNKTDADVAWVQIRDSQFTNLPSGIFEKFENMEKIMILTTMGFKTLNTTYFDKKITLVLMKNTDLEVIGENAFVGLSQLTILSLNYNRICKVHKNAFRDLVKADKIEMVSNNIESLDDDTFKNNVNLRLLLLYNNKIKIITEQLLTNNVNLESLQVQNNSITQIEKGFYKSLQKLTRADFSSNLCISESITLTRFIQWSSHLLKFKDCFNNYVLLKQMDDVITNVRTKMDDLETKVAETIEKVDNDLKVLENKMDNSTELVEFKTNLVKFLKSDQELFERKYENDLNNITSAVKTDLMDKIKENVVQVLEVSQGAKQEKLVKDDFDDLRSEFSGKFTLIYVTLFFMVCFACIAALFIARNQSIYPIFNRYKGDSNHLIEAEVC